ncbi:MAG TPA: YdcF family protein [Bacteroidales bacterium]|nr:YdcF family protein [Bacteroidales bacterium]
MKFLNPTWAGRLSVLFLLSALAVSNTSGALINNRVTDSIIVNKTFPLITYIQKDKALKGILLNDPALKELAQQQNKRIETSLKENNVKSYAAAMQLQPDEIKIIGKRLNDLYNSKKEIQQLVGTLKKSGYYNIYESYSDTAFLRTAWEKTANGINRAIDVYISGKKPFYAAIDAISFVENDNNYKAAIEKKLNEELNNKNEKLFFDIPVNTAMEALHLNQRDEAARYEPLNDGMNRQAYLNIPKTDWNNYKYSSILVPGQGPEVEGVIIDSLSIVRSEMAAKAFKDGLAPFIIVSGGHVHPNKTPYSEAVEMKKYMVGKLGLPDNAIFIEPHARHTTTNLRNAGRIVFRFGIPADKKILITTDKFQNGLILNMEGRCMKELGCVPYKGLTKLSDESCEFYPDKNSLHANPLDPLDP